MNQFSHAGRRSGFCLATTLLVASLGFRCAAEAFPEPVDTEPAARGGPMPAAEAAASIDLPPGFSATLMASEPDVRNPIALAWDGRGRLWIAENFTYADQATRIDRTLRDRVLLCEDGDGDGRLESRTVFTDAVQSLTSIEIGHGGVWLMCPPRLLFIPDREHDGVADGPPETILDGFDVAESNHHNFANGLRFGPDGWLYGRCGHSCPARIGRPGCRDEERLPMQGGMWRYSPRSGRAEVLAVGTTNPWGHDWTAEGECFFVNTVNGHLWHLIPGGHFRQPYGTDPNPFAYETIDFHADHFHFDTGAGWQQSRDGSASESGGGHAHSGCMIYAGTNWPETYRDRLFTLNFHGRRANRERLERSESGYVARHEDDVFFWRDAWFRGLELSAGPDGSVAVLDWSDTGECHEHDGVHRSSGRIYRLAHGRPHLPAGFTRGFDVRTLDDADLATLQRHADGWWVAQARLVIAERAAARPLDAAAVRLLDEQFAQADSLAAADPRVSASAHRVRAMLSLHVGGRREPDRLVERLAHPDEHVRTWAVRLLTEDWPLDAACGPVPAGEPVAAATRAAAAQHLDRFAALAASDSSGLVRLALASTLQRLPVALRPVLARPLVGRAEDADDHNLPLLVWYGLIPVADDSPPALAELAADCTWPLTRRLIARRLASLIARDAAVIDPLLHAAASAAGHGAAGLLSDTLDGMVAGLAGWRKVPRPAAWQEVLDAVAAMPEGGAKAACRRTSDELSIVFGDGRAVDAVRQVALDATADVESRRAAVATLIEARPADLESICDGLLSNRGLRGIAAKGLAGFDTPRVAGRLVEACRRSDGDVRESILAILVSRRSFAAALIDAIEAGRVSPGDLSAYHVRQLHALGDADLSRRLTSAWGQLRESPAEKRQRIAEVTMLCEGSEPPVDLAAGRRLYRTTCGGCHMLYGEGGRIGPDLTGSGRHDLGYLVGNVVDPSAVVSRDWRLSIVTLADGRVLTGVVVRQDDRTVELQGLQDRETIPRDEIDEIVPTDRSPMPDGLLDQLTNGQIRDLVAYLRHPTQVPLPAEATPRPVAD